MSVKIEEDKYTCIGCGVLSKLNKNCLCEKCVSRIESIKHLQKKKKIESY